MTTDTLESTIKQQLQPVLDAAEACGKAQRITGSSTDIRITTAEERKAVDTFVEWCSTHLTEQR